MSLGKDLEYIMQVPISFLQSIEYRPLTGWSIRLLNIFLRKPPLPFLMLIFYRHSLKQQSYSETSRPTVSLQPWVQGLRLNC